MEGCSRRFSFQFSHGGVLCNLLQGLGDPCFHPSASFLCEPGDRRKKSLWQNSAEILTCSSSPYALFCCAFSSQITLCSSSLPIGRYFSRFSEEEQNCLFLRSLPWDFFFHPIALISPSLLRCPLFHSRFLFLSRYLPLAIRKLLLYKWFSNIMLVPEETRKSFEPWLFDFQPGWSAASSCPSLCLASSFAVSFLFNKSLLAPNTFQTSEGTPNAFLYIQAFPLFHAAMLVPCPFTCSITPPMLTFWFIFLFVSGYKRTNKGVRKRCRLSQKV